MKVLIVDDDKVLRKIITEIIFLTEGMIKAFHANDGGHALRLYEVLQPDVIITDLEMPIMDGLSLIKEIRSRNTDIPIFLNTGSIEKIDGHDLGSNTMVVRKPVRPETLIAFIETNKP